LFKPGYRDNPCLAGPIHRHKPLCLTPSRFSQATQARGWLVFGILRETHDLAASVSRRGLQENMVSSSFQSVIA
jgi:hypothetical protein